MYSIDTTVFLMTTGSDFQSDIGIRFRQIAVRSLRKINKDISQGGESNRVIAHKIKGIALSCGAMEIARICMKCEAYDEIINESHGKEILLNMSNVIIHLCEA